MDGPTITDGNWPKHSTLKVGLVFIATGRYSEYIQPFLDSARKFFCLAESVSYFLFTDASKVLDGVTSFPISHEPWPAATLSRYKWITSHADSLRSLDYLFYCDVDSEFVAPIGSEILGELVAVRHPRFWNCPALAWYEDRSESNAYVARCYREPYCGLEPLGYMAGGFQGGQTHTFLSACSIMRDRIRSDRVVARYHDESHWNRYCTLDKKPDVILSPSYCFPDHCVATPVSDGFNLSSFEPKILALTKPLAFIRDRGN